VKRFFALFSNAMVMVSFARLAPAQPIDINTIIQRSVQANEADWKANPEYDWTERDLQPGGGTKTFQELIIFGSPYGRLIAVNGEPLSEVQQQKEQQKLDAEIAKRRSETPEERRQRIAAYEKEREHEHVMMAQLTQAFNFQLIGEQRFDSYDVYVLSATPKPQYEPPNMQSQALKGMRGKLWIDKATFQWVKVAAQVVKPVSIEGFLAKVLPGTRFELEKTPVAPGIWLPKHYSMRSQARVLFFFSHKGRDDETYWNYHRAEEESAQSSGK
jgi:hypothetical protein